MHGQCTARTSFMYEHAALLSRGNACLSLVDGSNIQHCAVRGSRVHRLRLVTIACFPAVMSLHLTNQSI